MAEPNDRLRLLALGLCPYCRQPKYTRGRACRRRSCPGYVDTWLFDNRVRILENLNQLEGLVVMTTITAPSLPWSTECAALGEHKHSPDLGCRVEPTVAASFNADADKRYSRLHKAAAQAVYRRYRSYPKRWAYAPEPQGRGVIHWHVVLAWDTPMKRATSRFYVRKLHQMAGEYGYGFVDRNLQPRPAGKAAAYISKYLTKEERRGLRELVLSHQAPTRAVYVHRDLTRTTRCTMRTLRVRRYVWFRWRVNMTCAEIDRLWAFVRAFDAELLGPGWGDPAASPCAVP